jgi:hypothetical protein
MESQLLKGSIEQGRVIKELKQALEAVDMLPAAVQLI